MTKFRFHVLGVPHTKTTPEYNACAYTQKAWKFCKMMGARGHECIHYGVEGSCPPNAEEVDVVSDEIYQKVYGSHPYRERYFKYDIDDECYKTFYCNAINEINERKQPNDFLLPFWGNGVRAICEAIPDIITVEPGIGYTGAWAEYRAYESYAIMHAEHGMADAEYCNPQWYWRVIPNYFDLDEFSYNPDFESRLKDPYFLFLGRVSDAKGLNIALQTCERIGAKMVVAGQLSDEYAYFKWPDFVKFVGYADVQTRAELMRNAVALFIASTYLEPFGGAQVETLLSGTPTITTDWGAFSENNIEGVTGYRCNTFADFVNAAKNCLAGKIRPEDCRRQGEKFSLENIAPKYEKFFQDIMNIYTGEGWYKL
jgi:glycosyltransferase involved in cell wall biosynthesis